MAEKLLQILSDDTQETGQESPEVKALLARLSDIQPHEMAEALFTVETESQFPHIFAQVSGVLGDQSKMCFSRGLKNEIESIYLELAQHLRSKTPGSTDLMNEVFDFLKKTLVSLIKTNIISLN